MRNYCAGVFDNKKKNIEMCVDPKSSPVFLHEYHRTTHVFILTSHFSDCLFQKAADVKQVVSSVDCPGVMATWRQRFVEVVLKARCI